MPVAIYARISSDKVGDAANVQIQVTQCLQAARSRGLQLHLNPDPKSDRGAFVDNNVSVGKIGSVRPGWEAVQQLARDGVIDGIIAFAPDRLYRLVEEQAKFASEMKHKGIKLHFTDATDADLSTPTGIFHAGLNALVAQYENDQKQVRIVTKKKAQAAAGQWNGGRPPLGYKAVPSDPKNPRSKYKLVKHPVVGPALQTAVADYLSNTYSLTDCLVHFREATGLTTAYSSWKYSLVGPSITGRRMHLTQVQRSGMSTYAIYMQPYWLENNATFSDAQWEPLISIADWDEIRRRLVNSKTSLRTKPAKSLLAGLVRCTECGTNMGFDGEGTKLMPSGKKRYGTYRCSKGNGGCGKMSVSAKQLDLLTSGSYRALLRASKVERKFEKVVLNKQAIMGLENELAALEDQMLTASTLLVKGKLKQHLYDANELRIETEQNSIRDQIGKLNKEYSTENKLFTADELWDEFTTNQRRDALKLLIRSIEIGRAPMSPKGRQHLNPDRVKIVWKRTRSEIGVAAPAQKILASIP